MQQFASNIQISKPFTISPSNVSHLKCEINGIIERQFDFEQLAEFIHPTPAMAGYPQIPSMDFLKQEPFARGLYSGLFGYELNSDKESIVLIRGIFVNKDKLDIYVGSGIVAGSSMADEWNELNNKEQMLLNYINQFKV
jgi:isochorismate synthase EntC